MDTLQKLHGNLIWLYGQFLRNEPFQLVVCKCNKGMPADIYAKFDPAQSKEQELKLFQMLVPPDRISNTPNVEFLVWQGSVEEFKKFMRDQGVVSTDSLMLAIPHLLNHSSLSMRVDRIMDMPRMLGPLLKSRIGWQIG
jgi:hypothetical protein